MGLGQSPGKSSCLTSGRMRIMANSVTAFTTKVVYKDKGKDCEVVEGKLLNQKLQERMSHEHHRR
jgi:hypothetical protein